MRQLHPEAIAAIQSKALFSQAEEALLAKINSVSTSLYFAVVVTNQIIFLLTLPIPPPWIDEWAKTGNIPGAHE